MIEDIRIGDITAVDNHRDIVIAMNTALQDVRGIGLPFVRKFQLAYPLSLGSVVSFRFDSTRELHMLICHRLGGGGWKHSPQFVRYGLDFLWQNNIGKQRYFSVVRIGTGRVGVRDGADPAGIHTAIATSHLPVILYMLPPEMAGQPMEAMLAAPSIVPFRAWTPEHGIEEIRVAA